MLGKLRRLADHTPAELWLLAQLLGCSVVLGYAIHWWRLPDILRTLDAPSHRPLPWPGVHTMPNPAPDRLCILTDIAARVVHRQRSCLVRSLLLFWLLRSDRNQVALVIGVNKEAERLKGHAWIETNGAIILETDDVIRPYVPVLRFEGTMPA
jgi:hypothetical protein